MPTKAYFGGAYTDPTTVDALRELQRVSGEAILLTQGSYSVSVSASAGTHDGGGVVDVNVSGWNYTVIWNVLKVARSMGLIAWYRTKAQGFEYHIHVVRRDCGDLSPAARAQVVQYLNGQNGLAGHGADDGPLGYTSVTWASYNNTSAYRPPPVTDADDPQDAPKDWFDMATQAELRSTVWDTKLPDGRTVWKTLVDAYTKADEAATQLEVHQAVLGITRSDEFQQSLRNAVLAVVRSDEYKAEIAALVAPSS